MQTSMTRPLPASTQDFRMRPCRNSMLISASSEPTLVMELMVPSSRGAKAALRSGRSTEVSVKQSAKPIT